MKYKNLKFYSTIVGMTLALAFSGFTILKSIADTKADTTKRRIERIADSAQYTMRNVQFKAYTEISQIKSDEMKRKIAHTESITIINLSGNDRYLTLLQGNGNEPFIYENNSEFFIDLLPQLSNLKCIVLDNCNSSFPLEVIKNSSQIEFLEIQNCTFEDITFISDFTNLKELMITDCKNVSDIEPLANLTNLEDLCIFDTNVSDITPLSNLTNLEKLSLNCNRISNAQPLNNLPNLKSLRLFYNELENDDSIKQLIEKGLLPKVDINAEYNMDKGKIIYCGDEIADNIEKKDNLQIYIRKLQSKDAYYIGILDENDNICGFTITRNINSDYNIYDFNYRSIDLKYLDDIEVISQFTNYDKITALNCSDCNFDSIEGIEKLANLKELNIMSCGNLNNIEQVGELQELETFVLSGTQVSDVSSLNNLPKLNSIDIISNNIENIHSIEDLKNNYSTQDVKQKIKK